MVITDRYLDSSLAYQAGGRELTPEEIRSLSMWATNNLLPDTSHIPLAWGRDFGDVSPLRGVILGGDTHMPDVAVTVMPCEEKTPATAP